MSDGALGIDSAGHITYANWALGILFGAEPTTIAGTDLNQYLSEVDYERIRTAIGENSAADVGVEMKRPNGTKFQATLAPISDLKGGAFVVVKSDHSHDPAEVQARLGAIVESSDDAIISKNLNGIIQTWNEGAQRVFGYSADEVVGKSITILIPKELEHEEDQFLARLRKGERIDHYETVRRRKDGKLIDVSVTISPVRNSEGQLVGASKVARDVTFNKRAETALKESEEALRELATTLETRVAERTVELEALVREMEGFTYTISHDLRTPLRAIIANCRILQHDFAASLPPAANRLLERQVTAANKMAALIDDLLKLSRLGRQELRLTPLDFSELVRSVVTEVSQHSPRPPKVTVQEGLQVEADETLLRLALQNLIENSVKFSKPNEVPEIEVGKDGQGFFVRDHGIGFEPQYAERIFAPFERLHRDVEYPGTGIGLANVRRIMERHGGTAWAEGRPGEGATFRFRLGVNTPKK